MKYLIDCVIFFGMGGLFTTIAVRSQYLYQRVSEMHHFTANSSTQYCTPNQTNASSIENIVASDVSRLTMYIDASIGILGIFSSIILCSWSDKIGRKIPLAINIFGLFCASVLQICIITFSWPFYSLVIVGVILGISGYFVTVLNLSIAYLSDIVNQKEKSFRFTLLESTMGLGAGLSSFGSGFWIKSQGFIPTSVFASSCLFVSLVMVMFLGKKPVDELPEHSEDCVNQTETRKDTYGTNPHSATLLSERQSKATFVSRMKGVWRIYTTEWSVCYSCNLENESMICKHGGGLRKGRVWRIWFYFVGFSLYLYQAFGTGSFLNMYLLGYPLCFTPVLLGAYTALKFGSIGLGPVVVKLNQKFIHLSDQSIILISLCTQMVVVSINAVARSAPVMFISLTISAWCNIVSPITRSQISSLVSTAEQGSALSLISSTEVFTNAIATVTFLLLYPATLKLYHGFMWLLCDMILLIPLFLMGFIWIYDKRYQRSSRCSQPEEKDPLI